MCYFLRCEVESKDMFLAANTIMPTLMPNVLQGSDSDLTPRALSNRATG
jgi:hypothetical protein